MVAAATPMETTDGEDTEKEKENENDKDQLKEKAAAKKVEEPAQARARTDTASTTASASDVEKGVRRVREVWAWNLETEFEAFVAAASGDGSNGAMLALDMEFPGFIRQEPRSGAPGLRYQALRENVDRLRPIQLGAAVSSVEGELRGVWNFNLKFDVDTDLHTEKAVAFLRAAGLDFPRHASEGIEASALGELLAGSRLVGQQKRSPWWVTFSGSYDLGYLLKMLTSNRPLPRDEEAFESILSAFCPKREELREHFPYGSLDRLAQRHGVARYGMAHTAGSDALLTLELFIRLIRWRAPWIGNRRWQESWEDEDAWNNMQGYGYWHQQAAWDSAAAAHWTHHRWDYWGLNGGHPPPPVAAGLPWLSGAAAISMAQAAVAPQLTNAGSAWSRAAGVSSAAHALAWERSVQGIAAKAFGLGSAEPTALAWRMNALNMWRASMEASKVLAI
eukprot:TRINITY_DN46555_c0_g1_i1.p1 TRINITY_DN46555_c0_g1~~TRINITY_DN46555_c0_g1_i1.p1  ORF type:complete len:507 (-),score=83.80 TRINITY_DN46555_c0_g1_i1:104-1450(-)